MDNTMCHVCYILCNSITDSIVCKSDSGVAQFGQYFLQDLGFQQPVYLLWCTRLAGLCCWWGYAMWCVTKNETYSVYDVTTTTSPACASCVAMGQKCQRSPTTRGTVTNGRQHASGWFVLCAAASAPQCCYATMARCDCVCATAHSSVRHLPRQPAGNGRQQHTTPQGNCPACLLAQPQGPQHTAQSPSTEDSHVQEHCVTVKMPEHCAVFSLMDDTA